MLFKACLKLGKLQYKSYFNRNEVLSMMIENIELKIPYTGNTWPSRMPVIKEYQYYTISLSKCHWWCQYHKSMSIGSKTVNKKKARQVKNGQYSQKWMYYNRNVYHGVRNVYHGVRKVYHGVRNVYHGVRKIPLCAPFFNQAI